LKQMAGFEQPGPDICGIRHADIAVHAWIAGGEP
jgi:hypothetical protein